MKIMKTTKIVLMALAAALMAGCYNDFDNPAPAPVWTDAQVEATGAKLISIAEVKQIFIDQFGSLSGTGSNSSWNDTKYYQFDQDLYIKGKVISNDREGNVYKSLFLQDETAAIEIRLTNGNFLTYHMGEYNEAKTEIPSQWVYVLLRGLYIGNYRMMLSIGNGPTDSYNAVGEHKFYANSNIELADEIAAHVLPGEPATLVVGEDIKVVNSSNYTELGEADFGRLIRFEGLECYYAGVDTQESLYPETYPDYVKPAPLHNGSYEQIYPSWIYTDIRPIVNKPWYEWAFSHNTTNLYGSVCFVYNPNPQYTSDKGVYMVRTSGYSRFSGRRVVKDGAVGTITGIYGIYSKESNYSGGSRDYATYQLTLNRYADLEFAEEDFLTAAEVEALTPADSYVTPDVEGEVD